MDTVRVKICGITSLDDALAAAGAGADALGFVFWPGSPRYIEPATAARIIRELPPFITTVGVFVDERPEAINSIAREAGLDAAQLHGDEPPEYSELLDVKVIKAFRVRGAEDIARIAGFRVSACLLDAFSESAPGGTGRTFDWDLAVKAKGRCRIILSGGLAPGNVREAVARVRPYGVDVSSGVESAPGKKDHKKVAKFIKEAKGA